MHPLQRYVLLQHPLLYCRPDLCVSMHWSADFSRSWLWGVFSVILVLFTMGLPRNADAQSLWLPPYQPMQFGVEAVQPDLRDIDGLSGAYFFTGTVSLTEGTEFIAEVPVAYLQTSNGETFSDSQLGNPYIGLALTPPRSPLMIEIGGRIPVSENTPTAVLGQHAEVGRPGAFLPEGGMITLAGNTRLEFTRTLSLRVRTGGFYAHSTIPAREPSMPAVNRDLFLQYSTQLWNEGDRITTGLGFTGYANLTSSGSYGANSRHDIALNVHIPAVPVVTPGVFAGWNISGTFRNAEPWEQAQDARRQVASWRFGVTLSTSLY